MTNDERDALDKAQRWAMIHRAHWDAGTIDTDGRKPENRPSKAMLNKAEREALDALDKLPKPRPKGRQ